jgi:hypothetical protein
MTMDVRGGQSYYSCFAQVFDVGIFGAGHAGFAAAMRLSGEGRRTLVVDLRGDVLWESGRAFRTETGPWTPEFRWFAEPVSNSTGLIGEWLDGAISELAANDLLRHEKIQLLYYAAPVAVEVEEGLLAGVTVATKGGLRRIMARQWIDATETGALARLIAPESEPKTPERLAFAIHFQQAQWPGAVATPVEVPELRGARVTWGPSQWANERIVAVELPGAEGDWAGAVVPVLKAVRARMGSEIGDGFVSHSSFLPYPIYGAGGGGAAMPENVALASPALASGAVATLVERFGLGHRAALDLAKRPAASGVENLMRRPVRTPERMVETEAHVGVAGLGVGGALAAIAAGREGAQVVAFDPLPFAGGTATGGGIPSYYWGVAGGLQDELDARMAELMPLFATEEVWGKRFHQDARRVALGGMLRAAGVRVVQGAMLYGVETRHGRVEAALAAGPAGAFRLRAGCWVDATGDGDLAAFAGAKFHLGRAGDGCLHAYTQSLGRFRLKDGKLLTGTVNFDSGYVDPTDSEDLTRARVAGIGQHQYYAYNAIRRPTWIAPQIGLRQGRHVETDYRLTIDDLLERRRFEDCVGLTGCHYDNHAADYEFESDDACFLAWGCGLRGARTACEIPYRLLIPKGLDNVWLACRAVGVSEEAHHSFRMHRDMQRIGEVCGVAAALAAGRGCGSRRVDYAELRARLEKSRAMSLPPEPSRRFGPQVMAEHFETPAQRLTSDERVELWLRELAGPEPGRAMWGLYRIGKTVQSQVRALLVPDDAASGWNATLLLAAWGDEAAEPRLTQAVLTREAGPLYGAPNPPTGALVPRWWMAVAMLRLCGTDRCLPTLADLARGQDLPLNIRSLIAQAIERVVRRCAPSAATRAVVEDALTTLIATPPPFAVTVPLRDPVTGADTHAKKPWRLAMPNVREDYTWQLHLAVARALKALDLPVQPQARRYLDDPRAIVRRAFAHLGL